MSLTVWVLLIACGTATFAAYETQDPNPKVCPMINGCYCNFFRNYLNCYNITALPNTPSWIRSAMFEGEGRSLLPTRYDVSPSIAAIYFGNFSELDLRHFFILSSSLTKFSLIGNALVHLRGDVFHALHKLRILTMKGNRFAEMSTELLRGLRVKHLTLAGNKLTVHYLVHSICQMNTTKLTFLDLSDNGLETMPDDLVKCVPSVEILKLNGNNFFKPGCLDSLSFIKLSRIVLDKCNITNSRTLQFIHGQRLIYASVRSNNLSAADTKTLFCHLNFKTAKRVLMSNNNVGDIDDGYFSCIKNVSVSQSPAIDLIGCNISTVSINAFRPFQLWDTVSINLHFNSISNVSFLLAFRSVQTLDIGHNGLVHVPSFRHNGRCMKVYPRQLALKANFISYLRVGDFECLPNLQKVDLSNNLMLTLKSKALFNLNSLKELDLSVNPLKYLEYESLPRNLRSLNLNKNFLHRNAFGELDHLTKLEALFLSRAGTATLPNSTLATLRVLRITEWSLSETAIRQVISSLKNIETLSLQQCNIHHFPYEELMLLEHIDYLDLSRNHISALDYKRIWKIPKLNVLNVASNNFECNCSMLPFSEWLRKPRPRIQFRSLLDVKCASPSKYYNLALFNFDRDCRSLLPIILPSTLGPIVLLLAIVTFVSVRYRGYIAYGFMLIRARWRGYGSIEGCTFKWDAFVSFNEADYDWVYRKLKPKLEDEAGYRICLHHRDFTIGEFITDNIVTCIDRSRKTLLILTDDFAKSQWCQLELSVAQHKLFYDDRDVVILVKLGDVSPENMTGTMQVVMRTKTYITWSADVAEQDLFWKQLILALKRPPGVELEELDVCENFNTSDDD